MTTIDNIDDNGIDMDGIDMDGIDIDGIDMDENGNDIDLAWSNFCENDNVNKYTKKSIKDDKDEIVSEQCNTSKCSPLNISTKTKISYLSTPIDLKHVFWSIPIVKYYDPRIGIIKKQMKFNSTSPEEVNDIVERKKQYDYVDDYIISQVNNDNGRNKFKDIRKISIGISRKDIISYRCKKKSAFYNCFVVIMRLLHNDAYKEIHVKVFNTGKLEIPGIQDSTILNKVLNLLVDILTPIVKVEPNEQLRYLNEKSETVMINSNFSCGYYINREKMFKMLKYTHQINSNFDPCSYPGIQCEFYYNTLIKEQTGIQPSTMRNNKKTVKDAKNVENIVKVSFMIFRTGSVLIVGKCSEEILYEIYEFLCNIFKTEYNTIRGENLPLNIKKNINDVSKDKVRKIRKKIIFVSSN